MLKFADEQKSEVKSCIVCSSDASNSFVMEKFDYGAFTGTSCEKVDFPDELEVSWQQVLSGPAKLIIDCRPNEQYQIVHFELMTNILHIPLQDLMLFNKNEVADKIQSIEDSKVEKQRIFVFCRSGVTSKQAVMHLKQLGFESLNVTKGLVGYKEWTGLDFSPLT